MSNDDFYEEWKGQMGIPSSSMANWAALSQEKARQDQLDSVFKSNKNQQRSDLLEPIPITSSQGSSAAFPFIDEWVEKIPNKFYTIAFTLVFIISFITALVMGKSLLLSAGIGVLGMIYLAVAFVLLVFAAKALFVVLWTAAFAGIGYVISYIVTLFI